MASGVNNAIARTASLGVAGRDPGASPGWPTATGQAEVTTAFRIALVIAASIAVLAAPVSFVGLGPHVRARSSARRTICPVDGPPLQPDPARCPVPAGAG